MDGTALRMKALILRSIILLLLGVTAITMAIQSSDLQFDREAAWARASVMEGKAARLRVQLKESKKDYDTLKDDAAGYKEQAATSKSDLKRERETSEALRREIEKMLSKEMALQDRIETLQQELSDAGNARDVLVSELEKLKAAAHARAGEHSTGEPSPAQM